MEANKIPVTKYELAILYKLQPQVLKRYMNVEYIVELESVGYDKNQKTLSPKVVRKFIECHGEPLTEKDFTERSI